MKLVVAALFLMGAMNAVAVAQSKPQIVKLQDEISIPIGSARILKFDREFSTINVVTQGIVRASAQTDRVMTLAADVLGETALFVYAPGGEQIYSARVTVTPDAGRRVQIFSKAATHDYNAYYCTETHCSRVDDKFEGPRDEQPRRIITTGPNGRSTTTETTNPYQGLPR